MQPTDPSQKPATAARIYDCLAGGWHNFPADRQAASRVLEEYPDAKVSVGANRDFLGRALRHLARLGVSQFLDIGSGIPTVGNVHEIIGEINPRARVVYVDIDPVAVAESLEILEGNPLVTAVRADMRDPAALLAHEAVRDVLDLTQPVAVLLFAVLHFVLDDGEAQSLVARLLEPLPAGSYLVISHAATETFDSDRFGSIQSLYDRQTATPVGNRSEEAVRRLFTGLELVPPGVVWGPLWQPRPDDPLTSEPHRSAIWCGMARKV